MRSVPLLSTAALLGALVALPGAAQASSGGSVGATDSAATRPVGGHMRLVVDSGLSYKGRRYLPKRERALVIGRARPYVRGQYVKVEVRREGRRLFTKRLLLRKSKDVGQFKLRFTLRRAGTYQVLARHEASSRQRAFSARSKRLEGLHDRAREGSSGMHVKVLHYGLRRLGFVAPSGSRYKTASERAVLAYRKTNKMSRRTNATHRIFEKVLRGQGAFRLRYPRAGKHVEFDWSRQVLVLARRGKAAHVYHASSGKASTPTVFGRFSFYRKQPGTNSKGMVHSLYFIRGYAVHGYHSVPTYPASHGCIRIPIPNARSVYNWIDLGDRIYVYR